MKLIDISAEDRAYDASLSRPARDPVIHPSSFALMQERGGRWAAYQNADLHSFDNAGHLKFLRFGEGCTFETPPPHYPEGTISGGTNYLLVGEVDFTQTEYQTRIKDIA